VLLSGEKGSGKTLLAKTLSLEAAKLGYPTITVNAPMVGDGFNTLLQSVQQPCLVFFDEFEKVYREEEQQEQILTLLDGVFSSKKLFIMTVNDQFKVNRHMKNRPGRLFYALQYEGIDDTFINEYCADNLVDQANTAGVRQVASLFWRFNFDMLKAMVEEMNRYNETAHQAIKMLNAKPSTDENNQPYDIVMTRNAQKIDGVVFPLQWRGNPLAQGHIMLSIIKHTPAINKAMEAVAVRQTPEHDDYDPHMDDLIRAAHQVKADQKIHVMFSAPDVKKIDPVTGGITYINKDGYEVTFTRSKPDVTGYEHLAY
jgi:hypothetical protein